MMTMTMNLNNTSSSGGNSGGGGTAPIPGGSTSTGGGASIEESAGNSAGVSAASTLEKDYYGCYCLKFIVKNGTHITEEKVIEDFGAYGDVVDVRGPGLFSGLRGNHVYVRFIERRVAELALKELSGKYHQLTPASISDVLPDNYGLYTISFYNKTGIPSTEVRREFSKFGEVKNLTGSLDVKGGRVFVSYKNKESAVQALQAFFFRKDRYPNMKFALPRCEKDYFGCFCLKFYNKTGEITYEKVLEDFSQYGEVVDIRGPGLFDVTGDDVYVRYKVQSSAEQALIELVGKYDSLCLAPPSDIQADKFGYYTITFVNDKCLSKSDVWYIFSKFGTVACVNGTFDCKKGRVFVSYKEKQGALNALETMLITKEYHLQVSKNSTVRKNDYNVGGNGGKGDNDGLDFAGDSLRNERSGSEHKSKSREASVGPPMPRHTGPPPNMPPRATAHNMPPPPIDGSGATGHNDMSAPPPNMLPPSSRIPPSSTVPVAAAGADTAGTGGKNGLVKFNRNVEMDIFGYYCLSFLNEDGEISEKKVRTDFSKFGEVVSVRGALGKQKGHVFVRFRKKEAAENCLNCLNSFPLSEMSELFGPYLYLSPATPRDIDCDMYGFYSISFLNLNLKSFPSIRTEFAKFGEIVRLTSGGGGNTDELVTISYADKAAAINALKTHFTNKDYPYLDIAKGSSLLLVNSSDSSDCEENEQPPRFHHHHQELQVRLQQQAAAAVAAAQQQHQQQLAVTKPTPSARTHSGSRPHSSERPHPHHHHHHGAVGSQHHHQQQHDPFSNNSVAHGSDVVDELLKPLQSYFSVFRTGVYDQQGGSLSGGGNGGGPPPPGSDVGDVMMNGGRDGGPPAHNTRSQTDKRYKIKKNQAGNNHHHHAPNEPRKARHDIVENGIGGMHHAAANSLPPQQQQQQVHHHPHAPPHHHHHGHHHHGGHHPAAPPPMKGVQPPVIHTMPGGGGQMLPPNHHHQAGLSPGAAAGGNGHATAVPPPQSVMPPPMAMPTPAGAGMPSPGGSTGGAQQPPPSAPLTNGFSQSMIEGMETEIVKVASTGGTTQPPPNLNEPPPPLLVETGGVTHVVGGNGGQYPAVAVAAAAHARQHQQQQAAAAAMMMMTNAASGGAPNQPPPPSGVMMSPPGASGGAGNGSSGLPPPPAPGNRLPMFSTPTKDETQQQLPLSPSIGQQHQHQQQALQQQLRLQQQQQQRQLAAESQQQLTEQLEADISNLSIRDDAPQAVSSTGTRSSKQEKNQQHSKQSVTTKMDVADSPSGSDEHQQQHDGQHSADQQQQGEDGGEGEGASEPVVELVTHLAEDMFGLYSLAFTCKSKDLSERRVKLDFGLVTEVSRIRGQLGRPESSIIVSFEKEEQGLACLRSDVIATKYPDLRPAPEVRIVPDKDGYFSIEFINTGMSGVREITNEFSKHGELAKVHQGGAKNAVKRVTVSYTDIESAVRAIEAYANNKDVRGIDFVSECIEFER